MRAPCTALFLPALVAFATSGNAEPANTRFGSLSTGGSFGEELLLNGHPFNPKIVVESGSFSMALIGLLVGIAAGVWHFMRESLQPRPLLVRVLLVSGCAISRC